MTNQLLEMSDWRAREREGQADRDVCYVEMRRCIASNGRCTDASVACLALGGAMGRS